MLLGSGERQSFRPSEFAAYYRHVRARLERFVADPPATEPYPVSHCAVCDFKPVCEAHWEAVDHLSKVAGLRRDNVEQAARRGDPDARRARERAAGARARRDLRRHVGEDPPAGRAAAAGRASTSEDRTSCSSRSRAPASRSCPSPRRATSSSTSRATRSGTRTGASSTSGGSSTSTARSSRSTRTTAPPSAPRSSSSSTSSTSGSSATPTCTSTTTPPTRSRRCAG